MFTLRSNMQITLNCINEYQLNIRNENKLENN